MDDASPSYRRRSSAPAPKSSRKVSEQKLRNIAELGKADAAAVERIIRGESKFARTLCQRPVAQRSTRWRRGAGGYAPRAVTNNCFPITRQRTIILLRDSWRYTGHEHSLPTRRSTGAALIRLKGKAVIGSRNLTRSAAVTIAVASVIHLASASIAVADTLDRLRTDRTLRIAYRDDARPFSY